MDSLAFKKGQHRLCSVRLCAAVPIDQKQTYMSSDFELKVQQSYKQEVYTV